MVNIIRSVKSGTTGIPGLGLATYNTSVELEDAATFFGTTRLPDSFPIPEEVLEATRANQPATDDGYAFFRALV